MLRTLLASLLLLLAASPGGAQLVEPLEWTLVGAPGAAGDTQHVKNTVKFVLQQRTGWGDVPYEFRMTRWEVKVGQYLDFLNAVACSDSGVKNFGLWDTWMATSTVCDPTWDPETNPTHFICYPATIDRSGTPGSYFYSVAEGDARRLDLPLNHWTYWRALRFANWLDNGQPNACDAGSNPTSQNASTTEDGSYSILGLDPATTPVVARNPGHRFHVASYDEYYKGAHHVPGCAGPGCFDCFGVAGTGICLRPRSSYPGCPDCEEAFDPHTSVNNPGNGDCRHTTSMPTLPRDLASNPGDPFLDLRTACDLWWPVGTFRRTSAWGVAELHGGMAELTETPLWLEGQSGPEDYIVMASPQWWNSSGLDGRAESTTSAVINDDTRSPGIGVRFVDLDPAAGVSLCQNGQDDDGDGLVDLADPGCYSIFDGDETQASLPCDDGIDNDADGFVDFGEDPACVLATSPREDPACQDGVDNDGKPGTDFDGGESVLGIGNGDPDGADPSCTYPWLTSERPTPRCGLGMELLLAVLTLRGIRRRRHHRSHTAASMGTSLRRDATGDRRRDCYRPPQEDKGGPDAIEHDHRRNLSRGCGAALGGERRSDSGGDPHTGCGGRLQRDRQQLLDRRSVRGDDHDRRLG